MKQFLSIIIYLSGSFFFPIFAQSDTLDAKDLEFEVLGKKGDSLYNINPERLAIKVTYSGSKQNPTFPFLEVTSFNLNG